MDQCPISREQARLRRVCGDGVVMFRNAIRASMLEEDWRLFLGLQDAEARAFLEHAPDLGEWVAPELLQAILVRLKARNALVFKGLTGKLSVERIEARDGLVFKSPESLLAEVPWLWSVHNEGGAVRAGMKGERSARVEVWAHTPFERYFHIFIPAWLKRALELAGSRQVRVLHRPPAGADSFLHIYDLSWE